jgi:hypothetical protein
MKDRVLLFLTAAMQVCFISMNTVFISKGKVPHMLIAGFIISLIWSFNIKKIAIGNNIDRLVYSFGALLGTGVGYYGAKFLVTVI